MSDFEKIVFRLKEDADGFPPVAFESLWEVPSGTNAYSIDNVPYYICGVSKGDAVAAATVDGEIFASAVIARSSSTSRFAEGSN
jgi:hypothetical protein